MALTSLFDLKKFLRVSGIEQDYLLQRLVDAADQAVKTYCDRQLEQATLTEFYDGGNQMDLPLRQYPVSLVTSVHVDPTGWYGQGAGAFAASTLQTAGADYALVLDDGGQGRGGILRRLRSAFFDIGFGGFGLPYSTLAGGRRGPVWPWGQGNVKVVYQSGFPPEAIPYDLTEATNQLAAWMYRNGPKGGLQTVQEMLKDYSYQLGILTQTPELGSTRQLLSRYKRIPV